MFLHISLHIHTYIYLITHTETYSYRKAWLKINFFFFKCSNLTFIWSRAMVNRKINLSSIGHPLFGLRRLNIVLFICVQIIFMSSYLCLVKRKPLLMVKRIHKRTLKKQHNMTIALHRCVIVSLFLFPCSNFSRIILLFCVFYLI